MKRLSDISPGDGRGDRITLDEVLDCDVILLGYEERPSKFERGDGSDQTYMILRVLLEGDDAEKLIFTGSIAVKDKLRWVPRDELPIVVKFEKRRGAGGFYYTVF